MRPFRSLELRRRRRHGATRCGSASAAGSPAPISAPPGRARPTSLTTSNADDNRDHVGRPWYPRRGVYVAPQAPVLPRSVRGGLPLGRLQSPHVRSRLAAGPDVRRCRDPVPTSPPPTVRGGRRRARKLGDLGAQLGRHRHLHRGQRRLELLDIARADDRRGDRRMRATQATAVLTGCRPPARRRRRTSPPPRTSRPRRSALVHLVGHEPAAGRLAGYLPVSSPPPVGL